MAENQSNWEASEPDHVDFLLKESSDHLKINPAQEKASIIENPSEYIALNLLQDLMFLEYGD